MCSDNPSWILVEGSDPATIQRAVIAHSRIAAHERPQTHRVAVFELGADRYAVTFNPPAPPYAFADLIGWLDDPRMCRGARRAVTATAILLTCAGWTMVRFEGVGGGIGFKYAWRWSETAEERLLAQTKDEVPSVAAPVAAATSAPAAAGDQPGPASAAEKARSSEGQPVSKAADESLTPATMPPVKRP